MSSVAELTSSAKAFKLKGSLFTLTVLQLLKADVEVFEQQLTETIAQAPKFFANAPIVIDLQSLQTINAAIDFAAIKAQLQQQQLIPIGVRSGSSTQQEAAKAAGLALLSSATPPPKEPEKIKYQTKLITSPVRSGQQIYAEAADLIVVSSVSHGAELLADGNIHVYGPLRGRALAGINDNPKARIFCHSLEAELVSVAGRYIVNETLSKEVTKDCPMQVYLEDEKLRIEKL